MKKALFFALALLATAAPARAGNPNLKYFGMWTAGHEGDLSVLDDLDGAANVALVNLNVVKPDDFFGQAHLRGMKAIVWLTADPDSAQSMAVFKGKLQAHMGDVGAILLGSEVESDSDGTLWAPDDTWDQGNVRAERYIRILKSDPMLKNVPIYMNFTAAIATEPLFTLPAGLDAVSFDQYTCWNACYTAADGRVYGMPALLQSLRSKMIHGEKMVLIPDANGRPGGTEGALSQNDLVKLGKLFVDYAQTHDDVVAILPFQWWTTPNILGTRDMPTVRAYWTAVGRSIVHWAPPTLAAVSPDSFDNDQARVLTFTGSNFAPGAVIRYGTGPNDKSLAQFVSSNELRLTAPAGSDAKTYRVSVVNPDASASDQVSVRVHAAK